MGSNTAYRMWDGVQVREEQFGLLFYDYRGPKLVFLPSRDLISESFFFGEHTAEELIESLCARFGETSRDEIRRHVQRILDMLLSRGLIYEQPIC